MIKSGDEVKWALAVSGMSKAAFARYLGVTRMTIDNYMDAKHGMNIDVSEKIENLLSRIAIGFNRNEFNNLPEESKDVIRGYRLATRCNGYQTAAVNVPDIPIERKISRDMQILINVVKDNSNLAYGMQDLYKNRLKRDYGMDWPVTQEEKTRVINALIEQG